MFLLIRLFSVGVTCGLNLHPLVLIKFIYGTGKFGKFAEGWNLAAKPKVLLLTCGLAVSQTGTFVGHSKVENLVP